MGNTNSNENREKIYNEGFYKNRNDSTVYSAKMVLELLQPYFTINSVIDFGCGVGTWLKMAKELFGKNVEVRGLDGDYVQKNLLQIKNEEFSPVDLSQEVKLDRRYDLAISLEVAEHLPESRAKSFVNDLCKASDVVLFSAATAFQGGDGHVNERRLSYWRRLFDENDYQMIDLIRPAVWDDDQVLVWDKQNSVLFVNRKKDNYSTIQCEQLVDVIHPDIFEQRSRIALHPIVKILYAVRAFFVNLGK